MTQLLGLWADDLFLHGHDLTRWITDYIDLEESLAVGSMAQEDLAHAAALFAMIGLDATDRDRRIYQRPVDEWHPSTLIAARAVDWPDAVARAFLFSEAVASVVAHLTGSDDEPTARTAQVIQAEQDLHVRHWHRWVKILSRDPMTAKEFRAALEARAAMASDLFGTAAQAAGELPLDTIHDQWRRRVQAALLALGTDEVALPTTAPRRPAPKNGELAEVLAGIRQIRTSHPDRRYAIYD